MLFQLRVSGSDQAVAIPRPDRKHEGVKAHHDSDAARALGVSVSQINLLLIPCWPVPRPQYLLALLRRQITELAVGRLGIANRYPDSARCPRQHAGERRQWHLRNSGLGYSHGHVWWVCRRR